MRRSTTTLIAGLAAAALAGQAHAAWIGSWGASPTPQTIAGPGVDAARASPTFEDQTIVQVVRLSAGGDRVRLRFSNEYGQTPLSVGGARVSLVGADGGSGALVPVTFAGRPTAVIPAGAPLLSDPIPLKTPALSKLRVALHVSGPAVCTCHGAGLEVVQVSPKGDHLDKSFTSVAPATAAYRAFLSGVEVDTAAKGPVIVTFGDSITDGTASSVGGNRRWPDRLAERLAKGGRAPGVVNAGIAANRVLSDGIFPGAGVSALARFDRDVLAVPGATHVVILEGVNDIGMGGENPPSAEALIAGYTQLIARAKAHGLKVIGATALPYEGARYFNPKGEPIRQAVNAWIRTSKAYDGVIDFDAAMRDPAAPSKMKANLQSGDWLHPNDAGYEAMANAVDLGLFR